MSEAPLQDYYPSWKCRLVVRLEEFDSGVLKKKVPPVPTKNLKGIKQDRAPLQAVKDPDYPKRYILKPVVDRRVLDEAIKNIVESDSSSDGLTHTISGIIPVKFDWKQNGFRTADELKVTLRWIDFPIDPRVIRSIAIQFFLGTLTPVEYARGIAGARRGSGASSEPLNVVPDTYADPRGGQRSNLRFSGWVDKIKMNRTDDPSVEFECRDNTQLLLNQLAPPQLVIGMTQGIDEAIATYLSNFPQFSGFDVEYRGAPGSSPPKLQGLLSGTAAVPKLGPQPASAGAGGGGGAGNDLMVWDYLTDVCGSIGHIIRIDKNSIIIQRPATLLHGSAQAREDDPFRGRRLDSGTYAARPFIYGRNVEEFSLSRDFSSAEVKNIELRCWSPRRKKVLVARFPEKADRVASSTPGEAHAENKWTIIRIQGVEDEKLLKQMAEDYYHGRNRNEVEVVIKTKNLASFGGGNEDPDILDAQAGDNVEILVDRGNASTEALTEKRLLTEASQMLTALGYGEEFANAYAKAYTNAGFQTIYRIKEMSTTGDVTDGVAFEIRAANLIQVRGDIAPKAAAQTGQKPDAAKKPTQGGAPPATTAAQQPVKQGQAAVSNKGAVPAPPATTKPSGQLANGAPVLKKK